ncbi:MAG: 50S ribosomal protein L29 [Candidatus Hydrogenedentes bacterium]|nr:50S ribosomal protein L29 [Candidatus Hydrogenedentota bacterium]MBI3118039.1 50S ribosomal protein L29 [Candidatus Hydrogenedentota bacterium]
MKASDLRELTGEELRGRLADRQKDLMSFRLQLATGVVENTRAARNARRDIARIKMVMGERARTAGEGPAPAKKGKS